MNTEKFLPLTKGLIKSIPGIEFFLNKKTGGTDNARYCYSVWMRHIIFAFNNGLKEIPETVGEIGPGDSLGIGLAAIISGIKKYYAFDIIKYWNSEKNIKIFDELVKLFINKSNIPGPSEFPKVKPFLSDYKFPQHIFPDDYLKKILASNRIKSIRENVYNIDTDNDDKEKLIKYFIPWNDPDVIQKGSIDMIYSQAVLEHIEDLEFTYQCMKEWLKPNGFMSHVIDFKSHGASKAWDGHRTYSDLEWKIIKGRKKFSINRIPYSQHLELINKFKFNIVCNTKTTTDSTIKNEHFSKKFKNLSEEDLTTSGCFIQAFKN